MEKRFNSLDEAVGYCDKHYQDFDNLYTYYSTNSVKGGYWAVSDEEPQGYNIYDLTKEK